MACVGAIVTRPGGCDTTCGCQCHWASQLQYPSWVTSILGSLSIGYSGISILSSRACTEKACVRGVSTLRLTYYFPSWFFCRMISLTSRWDSLGGYNVAVHTPRVVSNSSELFMLAQKGNILGVQNLLAKRTASLYDVSHGEGRTALHVGHPYQCNSTYPR